MNISVIQETADWILLNKPAGLVVHADGRQTEETLVDWIVQQYPEIVGVGEGMVVRLGEQEITIDRPGIVHRLDRDTSGVMVVARTDTGFRELKEKFQNRTVHKTYHAFVYGAPKADGGTIDAPIGRSPKDFRRWSAQPGARGMLREAVTEWSMVRRFSENQATYSCISFSPQTGRTHQIRVHAKFMHHPIVSDPLYAGKRKPALGFSRQALHASRIEFDWRGEKIVGTAEWPEDFEKVANRHEIEPVGLEKNY